MTFGINKEIAPSHYITNLLFLNQNNSTWILDLAID
jgi:hypothetical protein